MGNNISEMIPQWSNETASLAGAPKLSMVLDFMRARLVISFAFLAVALVCVSCSSNRAWPPKGYTEVRAFLYNLDSKGSPPCITKGRLHASMTDTNGTRLSDAQVSDLLAAVTGTHPDHNVAGCYVPHHAYVFFDQKHRVVGWVELCFGCNNYRASSSSAPWPFDIYTLRDLTIELGLPVLKKDDDYLALKKKNIK